MPARYPFFPVPAWYDPYQGERIYNQIFFILNPVPEIIVEFKGTVLNLFNGILGGFKWGTQGVYNFRKHPVGIRFREKGIRYMPTGDQSYTYDQASHTQHQGKISVFNTITQYWKIIGVDDAVHSFFHPDSQHAVNIGDICFDPADPKQHLVNLWPVTSCRWVRQGAFQVGRKNKKGFYKGYNKNADHGLGHDSDELSHDAGDKH